MRELGMSQNGRKRKKCVKEIKKAWLREMRECVSVRERLGMRQREVHLWEQERGGGRRKGAAGEMFVCTRVGVTAVCGRAERKGL